MKSLSLLLILTNIFTAFCLGFAALVLLPGYPATAALAGFMFVSLFVFGVLTVGATAVYLLVRAEEKSER